MRASHVGGCGGGDKEVGGDKERASHVGAATTWLNDVSTCGFRPLRSKRARQGRLRSTPSAVIAAGTRGGAGWGGAGGGARIARARWAGRERFLVLARTFGEVSKAAQVGT